jgi:hypothetical protein
MKHSMIAAISLMLLTAAVAVAEILGEHPVSSPVYGPPPGYRYGAASASDGHDFLVVWCDSERIVDLFNMRVYATRVSASGQVLDPLGIRIRTLTTNPTQFNVVYLGGSYLVCWNEGDGSDTTTPPPPLVGVRISADGLLLDSTPRLFADHGRLNQGAVATNGSLAVIAYTATNGNLTTIVLDRDANIVDGPRTINTSPIASNETALTSSNGRGFLVVQTFGNTNFETANATTLDASGIPLSSEQVVTAAQPGNVVGLASDGDSYVAIFEGTGQISTQHFGPGGEIIETALFPLLQVFRGLSYPLPGLVFTGDSYLFMDADPVQETLGIRRLSRTGQPAGGYNPIANASNFLATIVWTITTLASNGSTAFAGWVGPGIPNEIFNGSVIDGSSLAASSPFVIARAATTQVTPDAASSGTNIAIVWNEDDGVYAGRLTLDGQSLDGRGIRVGGKNLTEPRIAFDGANYIIGWEDTTGPYESTLKVTRLAPGTGALLDPNGIAITQKSYGGLAFAPAPNGTLLAWSEGSNVVASILSRDLTHGTEVVVNPGEETGGGMISAAWNGSEWLLIWENAVLSPNSYLCTPACYDILIHAARLSPQLALLDPIAIKVSETRADSRPLVASDGDGFLVTWSRYLFYDYFVGQGGYDYSVVAQRISRDGSTLGPVNGVRLGAGEARSIVWDGLQYEIASSARRYPPDSVALFVPSTATLNVNHVAAHGPIESLTPLAVVNDRSDHDASLIVTGLGNVAIAYTRIGEEPEYGDVERVFVSVPHMLRERAVRETP